MNKNYSAYMNQHKETVRFLYISYHKDPGISCKIQQNKEIINKDEN